MMNEGIGCCHNAGDTAVGSESPLCHGYERRSLI